MGAKKLDINDVVDIHFTDEEVIRGATIIRTPAGCGDLWQLIDKEGNLFAVNGNSSEFVCFIKKENQ